LKWGAIVGTKGRKQFEPCGYTREVFAEIGLAKQEHAFSSLLLQRCTPMEQEYAEDMPKTFLVAMDSNHE
jgi:hypothetical protein